MGRHAWLHRLTTRYTLRGDVLKNIDLTIHLPQHTTVVKNVGLRFASFSLMACSTPLNPSYDP